MRFLVDECFPKSLVAARRTRGYDVTWAQDVCRAEIDENILALATAEGRIVITEDRDFGKLTIRDGLPAVGVIIAYAGLFPGGITELIDELCARIEELGDSLVGTLSTISPNWVRQRPLVAVQS